MSGIRDTMSCPEFRDTCPESENSRFRVMKYPTTLDFWWEIKLVYVINESELLHSVDRHFRRLSIKKLSGYSGHFGTHVRTSPDTVKTDDRQKRRSHPLGKVQNLCILSSEWAFMLSASVIPFCKLPNWTKRKYFRFLLGLVDLELFESTYTPEKSVRKIFRFFF